MRVSFSSVFMAAAMSFIPVVVSAQTINPVPASAATSVSEAKQAPASGEQAGSSGSVSAEPAKEAPKEQKKEHMPTKEEKRELQESGNFGQSFVPKHELSEFVQEMKNVQRDARQILKDLTKVKGVEEWKKILDSVIKSAGECASKVQSASSDEKREVLNECRNANYFQEIQEIREQFVPPQEVKNELANIKNGERELVRFKRQVKGAEGAALLEKIEGLLKSLATYRVNITNAFGSNQREVIEEWRNVRFWDDHINPIRAQVEIPKQLKDMDRDMKQVERTAASAQLAKGLKFFGFNGERLTASIEERKSVIGQIRKALGEGDFEEVNSLMQEHVYNGWHPGDLRHLLDMIRETYNQLRSLKDGEMKDQIFEVLDPIVSSFNEGEYRQARDGMVPFADQMRQYQFTFQRGRGGGLNEKSMRALEKLQNLIQKKFGSSEESEAKER